MDREVLSSEVLSVEKNQEDSEYSLRPSLLSEFIGQHQIKSNLDIFIRASKKRNECLDHVLFYGPPGLGKTTLAHIISNEMNVNFKSTSGPMMSKPADLAAILTNLSEGDILFIDEIHRLHITIEEILYSAMEDFYLDIVIGEGPAARTVKINLPKFTLIGATTRLGLLSNPLRDRFGIPLRLEFYTIDELSLVIKRGADVLGVKINDDGANEIAKRSRGTPRISLRLLKRIRDFVEIENFELADKEITINSLDRLEVDKLGLDSNDYRYMLFICNNYAGGPVGIETISAGISEQRDTIEDTIEPYLIQIGFLNRTSRGRVITPQAFEHLGIKQLNINNSDNKANSSLQQKLFT
jgi:holliday junction DNA helicase RuvB